MPTDIGLESYTIGNNLILRFLPLAICLVETMRTTRYPKTHDAIDDQKNTKQIHVDLAEVENKFLWFS